MVGAKKKLLNIFVENLRKPLSKELLAETAGVFDWARSIRTLRQEGYDNRWSKFFRCSKRKNFTFFTMFD